MSDGIQEEIERFLRGQLKELAKLGSPMFVQKINYDEILKPPVEVRVIRYIYQRNIYLGDWNDPDVVFSDEIDSMIFPPPIKLASR